MPEQNSAPLRLSILDYSPVDEGLSATDAFGASLRLAQRAEHHGFHRYWVSEHHGMPAQAGNSPEILMSHVASGTACIRVGSGGVLLPNYSSLKIAENYQLLESLFPGRVDLGFGRAPGADQRISAALNDEKGNPLSCSQKVVDLLGFLTGHHPSASRYAGILAYPQTPRPPQPFVLGASGSTAQVAAEAGLGFTFAHFINPTLRGAHASEAYRNAFKTSDFSDKPQVIVAVFVAVGETFYEAALFADAFHLWLSHAESSAPFDRVPSLETTRAHQWSNEEKAARERNEGRLISGTADEVIAQLRALGKLYETDEVMINLMMPGETSRLNGIDLLAAALGAALPSDSKAA